MKRQVVTFLCCIIFHLAFTQEGYSSSSITMNRANGIISPDQVVVEEYFNYHAHQLPLPKGKNEVKLHLDYDKTNQNNTILQIGIATKKIMDYSEMSPINVSLVIDKSGSMSSDNRLEKVKKALAKFIQGLRPNDYLSIITYDSEAQVIVASQKVNEIPNIESIINGISSGGSTNLHGGLMLGYREVKKHFSPENNNKVILLTDGIANQGETDPEKIVMDSYDYNVQGIDLATIGVGKGINYQLLQQLSKKGKGANHFIGNKKEDIIKTFQDELESLLSPIGKNVFLDIHFPKGIRLQKIYGYSETQHHGNKVRIPLKNMNRGLTQIVLCDIQTFDKVPHPIKAVLSYHSFLKNKPKTISKKIKINRIQKRYSTYSDIRKNHHIATMAEALKNMARAIQNRKHNKGLDILNKSLQEINTFYPQLKDKDLLRVKNILQQNKKRLLKYHIEDFRKE